MEVSILRQKYRNIQKYTLKNDYVKKIYIKATEVTRLIVKNHQSHPHS